METQIKEMIRDVLSYEELEGFLESSSAGGGKKIRSGLFMAFCGKKGPEVLRVACALELIHAATLVHDDIVDNSTKRRARPAMYSVKGITESVLYGDLLFSRAFEMLADIRDQRIWKELVGSVSVVVKGEIYEQLKKGDVSVTEEEYMSMIRDKTGELFGVSCRAGAIMAGREQKAVSRANEFGLLLGTAYQIYDDCVDLLGAGDKSSFRDADNGIMTLPLIFFLDEASAEEKTMLKRHICRKNREEDKAGGLYEPLLASKALSRALGQAVRLVERACATLTCELSFRGEVEKIAASLMEKVYDARKKHSDIRRRLRGA